MYDLRWGRVDSSAALMHTEFVNKLCIGCFRENGHVRRHDIVQ